jgi:hypothetical protein
MTIPQKPLAAIFLVFALLLLPRPAFGQAEEKKKTIVAFEGSEFFRKLLHQYKQQPVERIEDLRNLDPLETTIIVFGDLSDIPKFRNLVGGLSGFVERGGALLIASDRPDQGMLWQELKVRIHGVNVRQKPEFSFRQNQPDCPMVKVDSQPPHPLFKGISKGIATNMPSLLELGPSDLHLLAVYSNLDPIFVEQFLRNRPRLPGGPPVPWDQAVAMAGTSAASRPDERVVVIAGHGVFMNGMFVLNYDNFIFANNCVSWLTEGKRRKHVLFIEEGQVQTRFNVALGKRAPWPLPGTLDGLLRMLGKLSADDWNRLLDKSQPLLSKLQEDDLPNRLQREGFFDRVLDQFRLRRPLLQALIIVASVVLVFWGLRQLRRALFRRESRAPLSEAWVEDYRDQRPVHAQRHRAMLLQGDLREAARDLARLWLAKHTGPECGPDRPAQVVAPVGSSQRRHWQDRLDHLWELAFGKSVAPVPLARFREVLAETRRLGAALAAGQLRIAVAPAPGRPGQLQ